MKKLLLICVSLVATTALAQSKIPAGVYSDQNWQIEIVEGSPKVYLSFEGSLELEGEVQQVKPNIFLFRVSHWQVVTLMTGAKATEHGCAGEQGELALNFITPNGGNTDCLKKIK